MAYERDGCAKSEYVREENIKRNIWSDGRIRSMENKN
jgi:hypothetical protein